MSSHELTGVRVLVIGQGYVGLPLAMAAVDAGHDVVGYDVSVERVKRLAIADSFVEDVPTEVLAAALAMLATKREPLRSKTHDNTPL